ncbi:T9SS type A sorting domain-containing protein [bacterium]|nr:T9SS type A sorting domain-containing protein [bacterium]
MKPSNHFSFLLMSVFLLVTLPVKTKGAEGNIVFVTDPERLDPATGEQADQPLVDDLISEGYTVTLFYNPEIENAPDSVIAPLYNADIIILGRACLSSVFGEEQKRIWNHLMTPLICLSPWAVRNSRLNWFDTGVCSHYDENDGIVLAHIHVPDDRAFGDLTQENIDLPWITGPYDVVSIREAGNGMLLASSVIDSSVLMARFLPWMPFYDQTGDFPGGYRTYMGNGNDATADPVSGEQIYNYHNFTAESRQVLFAEIEDYTHLSCVPPPCGSSIAQRKEIEKLQGESFIRNYPNPFNPVTTIEFTLEFPGRVQLFVYDISGHLVEKLIDRHLNHGFRSVVFDADRYASGIYFYRLRQNNRIVTKKMLLVK